MPAKIIDIHTHIWLKSFLEENALDNRAAVWPQLIAADNSIEDLIETYKLMFPLQQVIPCIFGFPQRGVLFEQTNGYVSQVARQRQLPGLLLSTPEWPAEEVEKQISKYGFLGLKPYLCFAPPHIASNDITIFDFLPHHQLEVANDYGWMVMLHIPRSQRLRDPVNLEQMLEIERKYPNIRLIIAHIGRAYCLEDVGNAFEVLGETENMVFDFCANTSAEVMEALLRAVGPKRLLYGSDMPILRMRMRRICEDGNYINLVPPGLYGDTSGDPHMREVSAAEGEKLSFFMYEELLAFKQAAQAVGLSDADLENVFYNNAARLIVDAGGKL
ncbi:MAG: amidohydrolase family protein [Chloroflexi bacterium]|nr:amidohydrolase family protein [Chloroflexota bacterium]